MPSGKVHLVCELVLLPPTLGVAYALGLRAELLPLGLGYLLGSLFLSPDVDLAYSRPVRRWRILRFIWWPYARVFHHRGLSHHPLLGPFSRLVYLAAWLLLLGLLGIFSFPGLGLDWVLPGLAGLWIPQLLHLLLDRL